MRIIAGEFRHRKIESPPDAVTTRPIPDRVKEAMFSLLRGWTEGATVIDAFGGSGAIGLEAVSRGAARCVFIEKDRRIADLLQRNIDALGCADRCEVIRADALGPALLSRCPRDVDLIFFDPPYALVQDPAGWERVRLQFSRATELLKEKAFAILRTPWPFRHRVQDEPPQGPGIDERRRRHDRDEEVAWEGEALRELEASGYADARLDDDEADDEEAEDIAASQPGQWVDVDLRIPGAIGPETHVYGSTAIHLYMRQQKES